MSLKELIQPTQGTESLGSDPKYALTRSFRMLLLNINVTEQKWDVLMEQYLDKCGLIEEKDRVSASANLTKELCGLELTWKMYCKGLAFLGASEVGLHIFAHSEERDNNWVGTTIVQFTPKIK